MKKLSLIRLIFQKEILRKGKDSDFHSISARLKPNGNNEQMPPGHQKECQLQKKKKKSKGQQSLEMFEKQRGRKTTSKRISLI